VTSCSSKNRTSPRPRVSFWSGCSTTLSVSRPTSRTRRWCAARRTRLTTTRSTMVTRAAPTAPVPSAAAPRARGAQALRRRRGLPRQQRAAQAALARRRVRRAAARGASLAASEGSSCRCSPRRSWSFASSSQCYRHARTLSSMPMSFTSLACKCSSRRFPSPLPTGMRARAHPTNALRASVGSGLLLVVHALGR